MANPIMFTDPSGLWRGGFPGAPFIPGTWEHFYIEEWYMTTPTLRNNPINAHVEFYIPAYFNLRRADMLNSQRGEVFEIKSLPIALRGGGFIDLTINVIGMHLSALQGKLHGTIGGQKYGINQYNWNNVTNWGPGTNFPTKTPPLAVKGNWVLYAGLVSPGLVTYWYEPLSNQSVSVNIPSFPPIPAKWQQQAGYTPTLQPVPVPVYGSSPFPYVPAPSQDVFIVGGAVILIAAGTVLIFAPVPGGRVAGATCIAIGIAGGTLEIYDDMYSYDDYIDS